MKSMMGTSPNTIGDDFSMLAPKVAEHPSLNSELTPVSLYGDGTMPDEFAADGDPAGHLKAVTEANYNPWPNPAALPNYK